MTLPPLIAHHGVLVYLTAATEPTATRKSWTAFNAIARNGTNGTLVVSLGPDAPTSFKQVLGIDRESGNTSILSSLSIPHLVLTTSANVCAGLGGDVTVEVAEPHALPARILSFVASSKRSILVVHIDVTEFTEDLNQCLETLCSSETSTCFVGIMKETSLRQCSSPSPLFPVPKQSWLKRDGEYAINPSAFSPSLVYSFYLCNQTRRDTVTAFDDAAILAHGGYGCTQAHVVVRELAFRLGYVPKYGA
ncbi:hypothetical protein H310_04712 [Aphanomyces invadans]|uniref:Uncharacterized protein n=1 Tax=Aphanomyces invadans TaxID=157072 RepID=A0A024UFQ7_9STRA|nr:hypothetical protein H310_04712 [Aphanomyces invadans]ETW04438.1 hypothetical protein H310_04712 [Aphanomyces invadans]|eukprot:XP_008867394.1 hypothetical protein H310_04712 [Aphanomyces invadans]